MKSLRATIMQIALTLGVLSLAACGAGAGGTSSGGTSSGGTSSGGISSTGSSSSAPTAAPRAKPTALPKITLAYCQGILSIAEANQIMQPATPATNIRIDTPPKGGGSCNYEYAPYKPVVSIVFIVTVPASEQGKPISSHIPANTPGTILTKVVSNVGDQAEYVAGSISTNGQTYNIDVLDVIYGAILFDCNRPYFGPSKAAADQAPLTNVCQLVISRL